MEAEFDHELAPDQWEALKALRAPASARGRANPFMLKQLIALGLAAISDGLPRITPTGRRVLIRGSSSLLDVAA
jgi:hypothetical protein